MNKNFTQYLKAIQIQLCWLGNKDDFFYFILANHNLYSFIAFLKKIWSGLPYAQKISPIISKQSNFNCVGWEIRRDVFYFILANYNLYSYIMWQSYQVVGLARLPHTLTVKITKNSEKKKIFHNFLGP